MIACGISSADLPEAESNLVGDDRDERSTVVRFTLFVLEGKARKMVTKIVPVYPGLAQRMSIAGTVKIEGTIAANGTAKSADVLGGHPVLAQAAIDAFRRSKWEPASHETKEVVIFNFHP
jgi:TonB family protein